jgi:hypothetical protein
MATPITNLPADGRLTSQTVLTTPLTGNEVMYIVSPGNAQLGQSYQVTTLFLATYFAALPTVNTTILTSGSVYNALTTDTKILVNKTIGSPTSIILPLAASMFYPFGVFIKDLKGDSGTNPITITFSGGQLCDNENSFTINNPYGFLTLNPIPGAVGTTGTNAWYQSQ